MNARHAARLMLAIFLLFGGCSERKLRPLNPCTVSGVVRNVTGPGPQDVDLLFMIDDSGSMADEQAALAAQLEGVVDALLTGQVAGEEPFTAVASLRVGVVRSDMGVLGVGSIPTALDPARLTSAIPSCGVDAEGQFFGEDGVIQLATSASPLPAGCEAEYPPFLEFHNGLGGDAAAFATDIACTAMLGTGGCGFEMQLESVLTAVTDGASHPEILFAPTTADGAPRDRVGQSGPGGANQGFFRPDSVIAIVVVTDEEDCSTDDPEMFMFSPLDSALQDPAHSDVATGDYRVNTRCLHFADRLTSIERYVEGLRALRPGEPEKIVFAGIVGVPTGLEDASPEAVLADPRMTYTDVLSGDGTLEDATAHWGVFTEPACFRCASDPTVTDWRACPDDADANETGTSPAPDRNEDLQWAAPGRRFVELAARLRQEGMRSVVRSICGDFGPAMAEVLRNIGDALRYTACMPRALNRDGSGAVPCDVVEILPPWMNCADRVAAGREPTPVRIERSLWGDEREVCRVLQLVPTASEREAQIPPAGVGWYYDDYTALLAEECPVGAGGSRQRLALTDGALALPDSSLRFECLQPVQGSGLDGADIGEPCATDAECAFASVEDAARFVFRYDLDPGRFLDASGNLTGVHAMRCEGATRTCQIACGTAADCPGGFVCGGADTGSSQDCGAGGCICQNPTCGPVGLVAAAVDGGAS